MSTPRPAAPPLPRTEAGKAMMREHTSGSPHMVRHVLAIEAEGVGGLRAALLGLRRHDLDDGPCWCSTEPNAINGWRHVQACRDARAALESQP